MRILYATDGSEGALCGAAFLAGLSHRPDIYVRIVTVLANLDSLANAVKEGEEGAAILGAASLALGGFPGHISTSLTRADSTSGIASAILFSAESVRADLIVLGASGHSNIARFLLGSVSEAVMRHADRPVLLARPAAGPLREVVIGIDGSEQAHSAACWTADTLPLPPDCAFHLVRCVSTPVRSFGAPGGISGLADLGTEGAPNDRTGDRGDRGDRGAAPDACLEPVARDLKTATGRTVTTEAAVGHPARELVRIARERGAGLVVVGSHGHSPIERFLLGSVSEKVLRHADCSVLVVRTRPAAETVPVVTGQAVPVPA